MIYPVVPLNSTFDQVSPFSSTVTSKPPQTVPTRLESALASLRIDTVSFVFALCVALAEAEELEEEDSPAVEDAEVPADELPDEEPADALSSVFSPPDASASDALPDEAFSEESVSLSPLSAISVKYSVLT